MFVWSKLSSTKWEDAWEERFHASANTSLVITRLPGHKTIRVEVYCHRRENAEAIRQMFGGTVRELKQANWAALSAKSLKPISIRHCLIIAHDPAEAAKLLAKHPEKQVLCIPGELAFGTGDHATTSTCLRLLCDFATSRKQPWDMLDLGCGTGILALAAKMLGATRTEGCDFDENAVRVALKNADLNKVTGVRFFEQDVLKWKPRRQFDFVVANIFYDVLTLSFEKILQAMKLGGRVVVSGILAEQAEGCLAAGRAAGIEFNQIFRKGKWVTAMGIRPQ